MVLPHSDRYKLHQPVVLTTDFLVGFPLFGVSDLEVFVDGLEQQTFTVQATFSDGVSTDAEVVLPGAVSNVDVEIYGARDPQRNANYLGNNPNLASNMQLDMDQITAVQQEQQRDFKRALKTSARAPLAGALEATEAERANKVVQFSSDGTSLESGPTVDEISQAQAHAVSAQQAADRAESFGPRVYTTVQELRDSADTFSDNEIVSVQSIRASYVAVSSGAHISNAGGQGFKVLPPYDVRAFGVVGDGAADDTSAFQVALDNVFGLVIPDLKIRVTDTLTITQNGQFFDGVSSPRFYHESVIFMDSVTPKTLLRVTGTDFSSRGVKFSGGNSDIGDVSVAHDGRAVGHTIIEAGVTSGAADVDMRLMDCVVERGDVGIKLYGRGLQSENNQFQNLNKPTVLDFPNPVTEGANADQKLQTGFRAVSMRNGRYHACTGFAVENTGYNADNLTGLVFTGNTADTALGVFKGGGRNHVFTGNNWYQSYSVIFQATDDASGWVISGNSFAGLFDLTGSDTTRHIADIENFLVTDAGTTVSNITVCGNVASNVYKHICLLQGDWSDIKFIGNQFIDALRGNNDSSLSASYRAVQCDSAGEGLVFSDNTVDVGNYTRNDFLIGLGSGVTVSDITNWKVEGTIYPSANVREHQLSPLYAMDSTSHVILFTGDGVASRDIATPWPVRSAILSCRSGSNVGDTWMNVVGTGVGDLIVNGFDGVTVKSTANALNDQYSLVVMK